MVGKDPIYSTDYRLLVRMYLRPQAYSDAWTMDVTSHKHVCRETMPTAPPACLPEHIFGPQPHLILWCSTHRAMQRRWRLRVLCRLRKLSGETAPSQSQGVLRKANRPQAFVSRQSIWLNEDAEKPSPFHVVVAGIAIMGVCRTYTELGSNSPQKKEVAKSRAQSDNPRGPSMSRIRRHFERRCETSGCRTQKELGSVRLSQRMAAVQIR